MPERPTVMISSTARDLPEHRDQVRLGCQRAGFPADQIMENLTALDAAAVEVSLEMVEKADVYVGIFAYRYGTVPDDADISITEMEYNRAVELNKPRLIFFSDKKHPVTIDDVETGDGAKRLKALKERIGKELVVAYFKSPEDLRGHVVEALVEWRKRLDPGEPDDARSLGRPRPPSSTAGRRSRHRRHPMSPTPIRLCRCAASSDARPSSIR